MMTFDFVLIDLFSQREAINRYVDGWSKEDILAWMSQYGEVILADTGLKTCHFIPVGYFGLWTTFHFIEDLSDLNIHQKGRLYVSGSIWRR